MAPHASAAPAPAELTRAMAATPMFQDTDPGVVEDLTSRGLVRQYRKGTYLFHQGDPAPDVFFLISGRVEISSLAANGARQLHTTLDTPQFFGELGALGDLDRTNAALALDESWVSVIRAEAFLDFLAQQPAASRALLRALARQVVSHEAFVDDLLFLDLKGRVAKRLLQLVSPSLDKLPEDGVVLPSVVTHADLASLCGGSRENVTRILSEFQRRGLIRREGRRYVLRKISGLAKLAGL